MGWVGVGERPEGAAPGRRPRAFLSAAAAGAAGTWDLSEDAWPAAGGRDGGSPSARGLGTARGRAPRTGAVETPICR